MSTHTPTPWYVGHDIVNPITGDGTISVGNAWVTVAAVLNEEDARFIVRAVNAHADLLAALREAANVLASDKRFAKAEAKARAALAKAEAP